MQSSKVCAAAELEDGCNNNEEAKAIWPPKPPRVRYSPNFPDDLAKLPLLSTFFPCRLHATTGSLYQEIEHTAAGKDLDRPGSTYKRELFATSNQDNTTEDHVNGSDKKCGRKKQEQ